MSSLSTAPELHPTEMQKLPMQILENKLPAQVRQFMDVPSDIVRPSRGLKVEQMSFQNFPTKDRIFSYRNWNTSATGEIWTTELTPFMLIKYLGAANTLFRFFDLQSINFSIKTNTQAFYQGKLWLVYEPTPIPDYFSDVFGFSPDITHISQLQRLEISPETNGEFNFTIPVLLPFDFMFTNVHKNALDSDSHTDAFEDFMHSYPLGRFYAYVVVPLETSSTSNRALSYPISISLSGCTFAGTAATKSFN